MVSIDRAQARLRSIVGRAERMACDAPDRGPHLRRRIRQACHAVDSVTGSCAGTVRWNLQLADLILTHARGAR